MYRFNSSNNFNKTEPRALSRADSRGKSDATQFVRASVMYTTALTASLLLASSVFADWPQWGGPSRDFKADAKKLANQWPEAGPKRIWDRQLGEGYSGIALVDGRLYTMFRRKHNEVVVAIKAKSGKTAWEHEYEARAFKGMEKRFGTGPNSTPLVTKDRVYTLGIAGHLHCLKKKSGKPVWSHDLQKEFGVKGPEFGHSSSPILYKDMLIVAGGGAGRGLLAFDAKDGALVWSKHDFVDVYSSPIVIDLQGEDQIVLLTNKEVVGIKPDDGTLLWQFPHENQWKTNISTPVWDGKVLYVSSGGEAGTRALRLTRKDDKTEVKEVWSSGKMKVGQGNLIRVGDYLYGSSGGHAATFISAISTETGEIPWQERGFAKAMMVYADGKFIILDEDGRLALATATPAGLKIHSSLEFFKERSWTVPTIAGTKMYLRDRQTLVALDLK